MSSIFPSGGIDVFANPTYSKVNGVDVVKAEHVNDLQDAVVATQETVAGAGVIIDFNSNNYIADNTSFKVVVEALDSAIFAVDNALTVHKSFSLPTDPTQHHSNVLEVTAIGNLGSINVQNALVEHQADIDNIMSGGNVEGVTLDDRYMLTGGTLVFNGQFTVTQDLIVNGDVTLGDALSDTVTVAGDLSVGGALDFTGDVLMDLTEKIAEEGQENYSYIAFESDRLEFASHSDFIFRLDADDPVDGQADNGVFVIRDGLGADVFTLEENGDLSIGGDFSFANATVSASLIVGPSNDLVININELDYNSNELHIQLDKNNTSAIGRFYITMDGDTGNSLASPDLLININENSELVTGTHILKSGIQETGYFGLQVYSPNATGVFFGAGVNFKHKMTNPPSSITLTIDENVNASNISITDVNEYGFFWEFDTPLIGTAKVRGSYSTIGN